MKKVLIVDDEASFFESFVQRCEAAVAVKFSKLQNVRTFDEAIALIESEHPDVVLLDAMYGGTYLGPELASWLIAHHPEIQVIGNSSSPNIWKSVPGLRYSSRKSSSEEIIPMLKLLCSTPVNTPTALKPIAAAPVLRIATESSAKGIQWDKVAVVRDTLTGQYRLLFTFDEPESAQRELYEEQVHGRDRLVTFLQISRPDPAEDAHTQRTACEHLVKLLNDEWQYSKDCVAILERVLHGVFMAGLELGYETRTSQECVRKGNGAE